jgi:hypothetical protein
VSHDSLDAGGVLFATAVVEGKPRHLRFRLSSLPTKIGLGSNGPVHGWSQEAMEQVHWPCGNAVMGSEGGRADDLKGRKLGFN